MQSSKEFWATHTELIKDDLLPLEIRIYLREEEQRVRSYCQEHSPTSVLEAGCSHGRMIEVIAPYCGNILGIDFSPGMVKAAQQQFQGNAKISVCQGDLANIVLPEARFDLAILAFNTFGNLGMDKERALETIRNALTEEGTFVLSVYSDSMSVIQKRTYEQDGLHIVEDRYQRIRTREGLVSQHFTKEDIEAWLHIGGFTGTVEHCTKFGYFTSARKIAGVPS
jgi:ubiquinone/menaquinone biosynthesis C-methylase UbiE